MCSIGAPSNSAALGAINAFLNNAGKVIILDADRCAPGEGGAPDYSNFVLPFQSSNPGPQGASGPYTFIEPSTLTAGLSLGTQAGDAVGDANIMTTRDPRWFEAVAGTNVSATSGPVMAYGRAPGGGEVLFEGEDFWFTFGADPHLKQVFDLLLGQQWNPDGLPGSTPVAGCPTTTATSSDADQLTAEICNYMSSEMLMGDAAKGILDAASHFPQASQIGTTKVYVDPAAGVIAAQDEQKISDFYAALQDALQAATSDLTDAAAKALAEKLLGGEIPCAIEVLNGLANANQNDVDAAMHYAEAAKILQELAGGVVDTIDSQIVGLDVYTASKDQFDKLKGLFDILDTLNKNPNCFKTYAQLQAEVAAAAQQALQTEQEIQLGLNEIGLLPLGGDVLIGPLGPSGGLPVVIDPIVTQLPPFGLPPGATYNLGTLPAPTINANTIGAGGSPTIGASGFAGSSSGFVTMSSSNPVKVGTFQTDGNGNFSMPVQIPRQTAGGKHELIVVGSAPDGSLRALEITITVNASGPPPLPKCPGILSGTINGGLTVGPGIVCILNNATVNGSITVDTGSVFEADSSRLNGGVTANSPTAVGLCGDNVNGSVSVNGADLPPLIGSVTSEPSCAPTKVTGTVTTS